MAGLLQRQIDKVREAMRTKQPPKAPELTYSQADFNPPSEFDMSFAPNGVAQGPAIKRSQPAEGSYRARMVSMEKAEGEATAR